MSTLLIVVNNPANWNLAIPGVKVLSAKRYLTEPDATPEGHVKVFNLCRSYRYQRLGYYVSLLAEARGHKPLPNVSTIQDLKSPSLLKAVSGDLDEIIQKSLAPLSGPKFTLSVYFARNLAQRFDRLSRHLFNLFPAPMLRATFDKTKSGWSLTDLSAISANQVPDNHRDFVAESAQDYFRKGIRSLSRKKSRFDLAMLVDPEEANPPSDEKALRRFTRAAQSMGIAVERVDRHAYGRIPEFDALFIRETTAVNHHTYRFARRAEAEGLVVIDDPRSIVRCTNKVYLAELLQRHGIRAPKTMILHRDNLGDVLREIGVPCILKQPDSAFSLGVVKAESKREFMAEAERLLEISDMLVAQEYLRTSFDWRIGVLDGRAIFGCKYYMARDHWQIYNNEADDRSGQAYSGNASTLAVENIPKYVVKTALKAANLIGSGLYGVDLKEAGRKAYVIEINDNPNIDYGCEDKFLGKALYEQIMRVFLNRLEERQSL